jgi:hypothetical protein
VTALEDRCFAGGRVIVVHAMKAYGETVAWRHSGVYKFSTSKL